MEIGEISKVVETLLFITDQPVGLKKLCKIAETENEDLVKEAIASVQKEYLEAGRAVQILEVAGGYQMATKPEYGRWVRRLFEEKLTMRLSSAALETLAIIAYRQPITRAEIELIRGVEVIAPLETLVERGLVKVAGRKETVGRPLLYGTTQDFLRLFGLNSVDELPHLEGFELKPQPAEEQQPGESGPELFPAQQAASQPEGAVQTEAAAPESQPEKTAPEVPPEEPVSGGETPNA